MLRLLELVLFFSPFLLFALWRVTAYAGLPSTRIVAISAGVLVLVLASLLWFQREGALPTGSTYVPAQFDNGRIIPGHGAPP